MKIIETKKDRKYIFISPFWDEEINDDNLEWTLAWPFGPAFSYQFISISMVAIRWPIKRLIRGCIRCIIWV